MSHSTDSGRGPFRYSDPSVKQVILLSSILFGALAIQTSASGQESERLEGEASSDTLLVPPVGPLEMRQDVQPLGVQTEKQGNAPVHATLRVSPIVKASIERPDAELRAAAMKGLTRADHNRVNRVVQQLRTGDEAAAQREWQSVLMQKGAISSNLGVDVNALIQWVLRKSYLETNRDLQFYAEKVRYFNELKRAIRDHLSSIREQYSGWVRINGGATNRFRPTTVRDLIIPAATSLPLNITYVNKTLRSRAEWEAYIKALEGRLNTVGDDAQLANIDLQNMLQKQQQVIQLMSNVSKMLHDTAMAVIRKIG
jgi:hypothetical protein